jgi:hypothetical protein
MATASPDLNRPSAVYPEKTPLARNALGRSIAAKASSKAVKLSAAQLNFS